MDDLAHRLRDAVRRLAPEELRRLGHALGVANPRSEGALWGVVRANGGAPSPEELQTHLRSRLPDYMVPRRFLFLEALPRTGAGKLDRRALAEALPVDEPAEAPVDRGGEGAPRDDVEQRLAEIWADVLGSDVVYVDDDFFELGGDSLLSIRVIARAKQAGIEIAPRQFFATPTIGALAAAARPGLPRSGSAAPGADAEPPRALPVAGDGPIPLTAAQEGFWFLNRLDPGNPAYNVAVRLDLEGPLDGERLVAAWEHLVRTHDGLRATVAVQEGEPTLDLLPAERLTLEQVDLSGRRDPAGAAEALARDVARTRFDLGGGPLVRGILCRIGEEHHALLLSLHHMVVDGESVRLLLEALGEAYRQGGSDAVPGTVEAIPSLRDYAAWERDHLQSEAVETSRRFWREHLTPLPERLELHGDAEEGPTAPAQDEPIVRTLSPDLARAVSEASSREGCTPFVHLLAVFQLLLHRHSGQDVVVTGSPVRHRPHPAVDRAIGYFQNMLPLRGDFSGNPSFREALGRVKRTVADALAHRDMPFERIVAELAPDREAGGTPLFQTAFTYRDGTRGEDWRTAMELPDVQVGAMILPTGAPKFDLALEVERTEQRLRLVLEADARRVDRDAAGALLDRFQLLLQGALDHPDGSLASLPWMTQEERTRSLEGWREAEVREGHRTTVLDRVEAMALRRPEDVAVTDGTTRLRWRELEQAANRMAHLLRDRGVGPDVLAAVALGPTVDRIVALLAVWKAGGAFLALDPRHPPARQRQILEDARPALVVTDHSLAEGAVPEGLPRLLPDQEGEALAGSPDTPPGISRSGASLAYVVYTSGSTGTPKGVEIEDAGLANLVAWHGDAFQVSHRDRISQLASAAFDASIWETWSALGLGATLVLAPPAVRTDPEALSTWLEEQEISLVFLPTPVAEALLRSGRFLPPSVRLLLVGGDRLRTRPPADAVPMVNAYGPSECTVVATSGPVAPGPDPRLPDIGRPIAGVRAVVLDRWGQPVPPGVPGELCLGGIGLARGYRHDAAATSAVFRPGRFPEARGARLYHTGDRVRWRRDGTLEFLGRLDRQVKVRGQRIEPGEVEAALLEQPGVRQCAVAAREVRPGDVRLVAWVAAPDGPTVPEELRKALALRLPPAMVPSRIAVLPSLPLNASGKVDRAALPEPELPARALEPPRGPMEELVAAVWTEVLGVVEPRRHEDFFALGGHSLNVTAVIARLERLADIRIPLRDFFDHPTVAGLAGVLESLREDEAPRVPTAARGPGEPAPLSPDQARLWYLDQLDPGRPTYNVPLVYRLSGPLDRPALQRALDRLVRRHEALRTVVDARGDGPLQVVLPPAPVPLDFTDLSHEAGGQEALQAALRAEATAPFDPAKGPLLRVRLFRESEQLHHLALTLHHLIADGWSAGILVRELSVLYRDLTSEAVAELDPPPAQYGDWCIAQGAWLDSEDGRRQLDHWRRTLDDVSPLELPTDRPRPGRPSHRGGRHSFSLAPGTTAGLLELCRTTGVTPFVLLLATFKVLLHRYSGQTDLAVGTVTAGRRTVEEEGIVGFLANTVVLRSQIEPELPFREFLARVRRTTVQALAHHRVPFGRVVEAIQPARDPSRNPLFQVLFTLQNPEVPTLELPGMTVQEATPDTGTAKFDLTLAVEPDGDSFLLHLEYSEDLFEPATVHRMEGHLRTLLSGIAEGLDGPISALPVVEDRSEWAWQGDPMELPLDATVIRSVSRQARSTPHRVAVTDERGASLSYADLDAGSDRVARRLRSLGVGPGDVVGVGLPRTPDLVVVLLGIQKAGGAYLPLDPEFPASRLEYIVEDAGARFLITTDAYDRRLPAGPRRLLLEEALSDPEPEPGPGTLELPRGADPAYVLYTSGSTGGPKGVVVTHRNLANLLQAMAARPGMDPDTRLLAITTLSFDISALEIFGPLTVGGQVILASTDTAADGPALTELLERARPNAMQATPTTWRMLLDAGWPGDPGLQALVGGEALPLELAGTLAETCREVWNMYGPTETTIWSTCWRVEAPVEAVRIGTPVANTTVYILDAEGRPVPRGVPGELHIGGAGVAQGYRGRPDLTAARFLPDPFTPEVGARMYRTGDRVRARADGTLEFLGRLDGQVKVRGYRIEVAEVEHCIEAHPGVRQAVVRAFEVGTPDARLVAFVLPTHGAVLSGSELRRFVRDRLPRYMVPGMVSVVEELPRTPNGKVDRGALGDPLEAGRGEAASFQRPVTETEKIIARVWSELLPGARIGRHDNFFELGGHSLLSIQAVAGIEDRTGRRLDPRALFFQTVEQLAAGLDHELETP
ncbi:MAG: amino acid adenylation domain-containing protein [Gemmatimonadota bacterium]